MTDFDVTFSVAGAQGPQGAYTVDLFLRASVKPAVPTDVTWTASGGVAGANAAGWATTAPTGPDTLWFISAPFDPSSGTSVSAWSAVARYVIPDTAADLASAQTTDLRATNVQDALEELQGDINDLTAVDIENVPTSSLAATDVQEALNELQGEIDGLSLGGSVGALTSAQRRKLTEIAEVGTATYANAPGANIARSDGTAPPAPMMPFSHPFTGAGGRPLFFEVTAGTSIATMVISRLDSSGSVVGNPVDVSGATPASNTDPSIDRYLTGQAITVPSGGSLLLQVATRSFTDYTLSNKYRIPSAGVTRSAAGGVAALNVEAALVELQAKLTSTSTNLATAIQTIPANAADVDITSSTDLVALNVQTALEELQSDINTINTAAAALVIPADAGDLSVDATTTLLATNVQDALEELQNEITALVIPANASQLDSTADPINLGLIATNVQAALEEILGKVNAVTGTVRTLNAGDIPNAADLDPTTGTGLTATNVQDALVELKGDIKTTNATVAALDAGDIPNNADLDPTTGTGLTATNVQASLVELKGDAKTNREAIAALNTPADAAGLSVDPSTSGLVSTNVQAALEELEGEIEGVAGHVNLSSSNARKLADVMERANTVRHEPGVDTPDSVGLAVSATSDIPDPGDFAYPFTSAAMVTQQIYISVAPSITSLENHVIWRQIISTGDYNGTFEIANAVAQTNTVPGRDIYLTAQPIGVRPGERLRLFRTDTVYDRYTLSSKYRIPSTGVFRSDTALLAGDTVEEALETLQGELAGTSGHANLSAANARKLVGITEGTEYDYTTKAGATLALGDPTPGPFTATITPRTGAETTRVYIEVPTGTDITDLYLRHFDVAGDVESTTPLSIIPEVSLPNTGQTRYRTASDFTLDIGDTVALQTRTTRYLSYTLSNKYRLPTEGVTRAPTANLSAENVEAALVSIQDELDEVVSVTPDQRNKLADIATVYAYLPDSTLALATTDDPPVPVGAFESVRRNAFTARVFFEVPTGVSIAEASLHEANNASVMIKMVDVSDAERQSTSNSGKDRYLTRHTINIVSPLARVSVYAPLTHTMSNKYRISAASVTGLPAPVPGPAGPAGSDGSLSALNTRKLGDITEGTSYTYEDVTGAELAVQITGGVPGTFASSITGITSAATERVYFEITAGMARTDLRLRHLRSDGTVVSDTTTAVTTAVVQANPSSGKDRYRTVDALDLQPGDTVELQTRTISYDTYTLSDKYRLAASSVTGLSGGGGGGGGAQGRYQVRLYKRSTSVLTAVSATWTASDGSLSANAAGWSLTVPSGNDPLWSAVAVFDPAAAATTITSWGTPYRLTGPAGATGPQGPAGSGAGGGSLSALDARKIGGITEATSLIYADQTGSQLSFDVTGGNPVFTQHLTTASDADVEIYVEIPAADDIALSSVREYSAEGTLVGSIAGVTLAQVQEASSGKARYVSRYTPAGAGNTITVQVGNTQYDTYTFSNKYRLPAAGLEGNISGSAISNIASGNLESTDVQSALNELQGEIDDLPQENDVFFGRVELTGKLTGLSNATDFYYRAAADLPERNLSNWTHVTNGQFPQASLSAAANYVVLLAEKHPNQITWAPDSTQPTPGAADPSTSTVSRTGFHQVSASQLPEGFRGWQFLMPAWNSASAALTGARLQIGTLSDQNVSRINLDSTIKITDDNLDLQNPTTVLTDTQHDKLQAIQLKTFDKEINTTGKTSSVYDLLLASAWPDPDVIYYPGGTISAQKPRYTGLRTVGSSNTFFNLLTHSTVSLGKPDLPASGVASLVGLTDAGDRAACSGINAGTIQARDRTSESRMRIDDDEGLMATMTLHTPANLASGDHPILNIGNENTTGARTLLLHKLANHPTDGGGLSLRIREITGTGASTTQTQNVATPLQRVGTDEYSRVFHPGGSIPLSLESSWEIPTTFATSSSARVTYQLFIRVWLNNQDLGEHDFTASLPSAIQTMDDFDTAVSRQAITLPFGTAGFSGLGDLTAGISYAPPIGASPRRLDFTIAHLSRAGYSYAVRVNAVKSQTITIPGGTTSPVDLGAIPAGGVHEIGFYVRSQAQSTNERRMRYRCSVNGAITHSYEDTGSGTPPTGPVPVTFGGSGIAVNRFTIVKPKAVLTPAQMNELTTVALRNREEVGGLIEHAGGTFHEAFSPAYKSTMFTNDIAQNLAHPTDVNSDRESTKLAVPTYVNWTNPNTPPELSITSTASELKANTNFTASTVLNAGVLFNDTALVTAGTGRTISPKAFLLLAGEIEEKIGSGDWTTVPGPILASEIRAQLLDDGGERPAELAVGVDALIRRNFTTVVNFKRNALYRVKITGYRLHGDTGTLSTTDQWPTGNSIVQLATNKTFLMLNITPTI